MRLAPRAIVASLALGFLVFGSVADAQPTRVALVRPATANASVSQALTRIQGELTADGFDVVFVDSPGDADQASSLGDAGRDTGALASIGLFVDPQGRTAELRVIDRLTNKAVIRRTPIDETDTAKAAEVLAVRAVELLRASLLELLIESDTPAPTRARAADARIATKWAAQALRHERPPRWGFELGTAVFTSFGGIGPALLGVFRGRFALVPALAIRATIAGLGTAPRVEAPTGSATVTEDVGLLELVATPWTNTSFRPSFSLGVGTLYSRVEGDTDFPYVDRRSSQWALAADAGAGLQVQMGPRLAASLEAHALLANPYPVVRFLDDDAARGGQPSIFATLTLVGWL